MTEKTTPRGKGDHVDKKIPFLRDIEPVLQICNDFRWGGFAIKNFSGNTASSNHPYLPQWSGESAAEYRKRMAATNFRNHFDGVINHVSQKITEKPPTVTGLDELDLEDVDMDNNDINTFVKDVCVSSLVSGAEFVAVQSRPGNEGVYFKRYPYKDLISWQRSEGKLSEITFKEKYGYYSGDKYIEEERFIKFTIGGGVVYTRDHIIDTWENSLKDIPVVGVFTGKKVGYFKYIPLLYDLALENMALLACTSSEARLTVITTNPILSLFGRMKTEEIMGPDGKLMPQGALRLGSFSMLTMEQGQKGKDGVEFTTVPSGTHEAPMAAIDRAEANCDGMSMNIANKDKYQTVVDSIDNQNKANPLLGETARELERKFSKLIDYAYALMKIERPADAGLDFKKDFDERLITKEGVIAVKEMTQAGAFPLAIIYEVMERTKMLGEDFDIKKIVEKWGPMGAKTAVVDPSNGSNETNTFSKNEEYK